MTNSVVEYFQNMKKLLKLLEIYFDFRIYLCSISFSINMR